MCKGNDDTSGVLTFEPLQHSSPSADEVRALEQLSLQPKSEVQNEVNLIYVFPFRFLLLLDWENIHCSYDWSISPMFYGRLVSAVLITDVNQNYGNA